MTVREQFEEFISANLENVLKLANIYEGNPQDAEDIVSESIEKALRSVHTLREPEAMSAWFYKIVVNTAINHQKKRAKTVSFRKGLPLHYIADFSQLEFEELLKILPPENRRIIYLRFCNNYGLKEIAQELDMNESTVKTRLYRSLKKLRLEITKDGDRLAVEKVRSMSITKTLVMWLVTGLVSATCVFNLFPSLAVAAYELPVIGDIVRVITLNRFEYNDRGFDAKINIPEIQGLLDSELQNRINANFQEFADELIISFEQTIHEIEESEMGEQGEPVNMSIKADYTVKTDNDRVLSVDAYLYSDVNGFTVHKFSTIDKVNKTLVTLEGLFEPESDYITPISEYIIRDMLRQNEEEGALFNVGDTMFSVFMQIRPDHNFYINSNGHLVICFDKYEVAAAPQGSPEFVIPTSVIEDIVNSEIISS